MNDGVDAIPSATVLGFSNILHRKLLDPMLGKTIGLEWVQVTYATPDNVTHRQRLCQSSSLANITQRVSCSDRHGHATIKFRVSLTFKKQETGVHSQ